MDLESALFTPLNSTNSHLKKNLDPLVEIGFKLPYLISRVKYNCLGTLAPYFLQMPLDANVPWTKPWWAGPNQGVTSRKGAN